MISLITFEYELSEPLEITFSRFKWAIKEKEYSLIDDLLNYNYYNNQTDWAGYLDKENLEFRLKQPGFFLKNHLDVSVKGKIELKGSFTNIKVKAGLSLFSALFLLFLTASVTFSFIQSFIYNEFEIDALPIFIMLGYSLVCFLVIRYRLKNTEKKLDKLFA